MMGLLRRGPSIVAVKSNTAVPVKETVFIATAMPSCRNRRAGVWKHLFVCIEIRTWKSQPMLQGVSKLHWIRLYTFEKHLWGTFTIPKKEFINYSQCYPNCQVNWKTSIKCVTNLRCWMVRKNTPAFQLSLYMWSPNNRACWCLTSSGFQECEVSFRGTVDTSSRGGLSL